MRYAYSFLLFKKSPFLFFTFVSFIYALLQSIALLRMRFRQL